MTDPAVASFRRRARRPWRIALLVYALGLTAGTHWPRLTLDAALPTTDKTLHLLAFGGLAALLRLAGITRSAWTTAVAALVWAVADELTQAVPGLQRDVNLLDVVGGALGIGVAALWIAAFADVGARPNRARLAVSRLAFDRAFMRGATWAWLAAIFVAGVAAGMIAFRIARALLRPAVVASAVIAFVLGNVVLWRAWMPEIGRVRRARICPDCGTSCLDAAGACTTPCPGCGAPRSPADWPDPTPPGPAAVARASGPSVALLALAFVAVAIVLVGLPLAWGWIVGSAPTVVARAARLVTGIPPELEAPVDLAGILALLAIAVRLYRGRLAHCYDRTERCRVCGHDLRGTPKRDGALVCGECGGRLEA